VSFSRDIGCVGIHFYHDRNPDRSDLISQEGRYATLNVVDVILQSDFLGVLGNTKSTPASPKEP